MELWDGIFKSEKLDDLYPLLEKLNTVLVTNKHIVKTITSDLVDTDFLDEVKRVINNGIDIYFGRTLKDLKVVVQDDNCLRNHEIFVEYKAPKQLSVVNVKLPHSSIQNREYRCLEELIETFRQYINELSRYFYELEHMDQCCTIMEPINASFKDEYRRILLDDRTWLHIEVTPEGLATNIHLVGQSVQWHNKLQSGLLTWDHDKNIVENMMIIFDLNAFPHSSQSVRMELEDKTEEALVCGICLCPELPEMPGVPQPLCQNSTCGVYYHRSCLYQWLVACAGSRAPAFGMANGACPTCLQPITCSEKDN